MPEFRHVAVRRFAAISVCALPLVSYARPADAGEAGNIQLAQSIETTDTSTNPLALPPVVVSATLVPTPESQLGSSVTVITSQDIEAKQERTLPEVLNDVPGLNVVQTGSPGGTTSVFIRGTNSNHTKVLIDGIDVSDPSSPDDSFDF